MVKYEKPLPLITPVSKVFYDGCKSRRLLYQHCHACDRIICFPKILCPGCLGSELTWKASKGSGVVFSFTITRAAAPSEFSASVPYVLAIVRLDEGFKLMSNIEDCDLDTLHCDMRVEVQFDDITEEITLPKFRPVEKESSSYA